MTVNSPADKATEELLPCPFCGGAANERPTEVTFLIECTSLLCDLNPVAMSECRDKAISKWNRRAAVAPAQPPALTVAQRQLAQAVFSQVPIAAPAQPAHAAGVQPHCPYCSSMGYPSCAHLTAPADRAAEGEATSEQWRELFFAVAQALNCLPSGFIDGNEHVIAQAIKFTNAAKIRAAEGEATSERKPLTGDQVIELLLDGILIDSGVSMLREGDEIPFSLEELTDFANKAREQHHSIPGAGK